MQAITVVLADDNLIVREGVRALLAHDPTVEVVGVAGDYDELITQTTALAPQVLVTDIRMPPTFQDEGIEGAREMRKRQPGIGVVVLSQYDSPDYAINLLSAGSAGYAYLLKDRVADSDRLARAIREVAAGGSMLDPEIVSALISPARSEGTLSDEQEELLRQVAEGRPVKAIAAASGATPEAVNDAIEALFLTLARGASAGQGEALRQLRMLHAGILEREEQGRTLSRLLPSGLADKLRTDRASLDGVQRLDVTVLMSDVRGYSGISERTDSATLAAQLNAHRNQMNAAILSEGGTVMQYVGDAVMAVFGAPNPQEDHASCAVRAALAMHTRQRELDRQWESDGLEAFGLGIGISTGEVSAAMLGSEERIEWTVVGDTVNLAQRLQDLARPAGMTVASKATVNGAHGDWPWEPLGDCHVKGREGAVALFRLGPSHSIEGTS